MSHTGVGISDVTFLSFFFLSRSKSKNNRPFWPTLLVKTFVHRFIFIPTCISRSEVFLNWKLAGWCVWRQLGCQLWGLCWNNISSFELFHIMRRSEFVYLKLGKKTIILLLYYAYNRAKKIWVEMPRWRKSQSARKREKELHWFQLPRAQVMELPARAHQKNNYSRTPL